jgi:hypothetical protein
MGVPILFASLQSLNGPAHLKKNRLIIFLIGIVVISFCFGTPVFGQNDLAGIRLLQVDTSGFPKISFYLESSQPDASILSNLSEQSMQVMEDGINLRPVDTLQRIEPGIQVILAYNLGPALSNTTVNGGTRYQAVNESLINWLLSLQETGPDDFSLATNTGLQSIRLNDPVLFADELSTYDPQLATNQPNLTSLLQSLDLSTDPNPNPLMKRVIFYVTPQPNITNLSAVPGLIDRAVQQDVKVFVWLVAPASVETSNPVAYDLLKQLTEKTGGEFFLFTGQEALPDPEDYLRPLRSLFSVTYTSVINQPGTHQIAVQIQRGDTLLESEHINVPLAIRPPNLILLEPVLNIDRTWQNGGANQNELSLFPKQDTINFITEFPDGFPRDLVKAELLINGEVVKESNSPPFNQFVWDFSEIDTSQVVEVSIAVQDVLGLTGQSSPALVQVTVAEPPLTFWQSIIRFQLTTERWIILASVLTTGAVLVVAIVLASKRRNYWREKSAAREKRTDPLTQPVPILQEIPRSSPIKTNSYPKTSGLAVSAWLVPLNERFEVIRSKAIPLNQPELIVGRDEKRAGLVIPSAAMAGVHARLTQSGKNDFWLADNGSEAGTWVNYTPVSTQGIRLQHGDLIHFARNAYRFELINPPVDREPQLMTYNGEI